MTEEELQEWFQTCEMLQDPDQWNRLAMAYLARGYVQNARFCFQQADACPGPIVGRTEAKRMMLARFQLDVQVLLLAQQALGERFDITHPRNAPLRRWENYRWN